jgi:hypothetical protein
VNRVGKFTQAKIIVRCSGKERREKKISLQFANYVTSCRTDCEDKLSFALVVNVGKL